jgi:subtilase family serine protease
MRILRHWAVPSLVAIIVALTATASSAQVYRLETISHNVISGQLIANNTPSYVHWAKNLGAADPSAVIDVSLWLKVHNRAGMDQLARSLYDRTSPNYRHWLKMEQVAARFGPTAQEARMVEQFLQSHNLRIVWVGPNNFFIRARGTVRQVEAAFHVQLNNYQEAGKEIRANADDPYIDGPAAEFVNAIEGLDSGEYESQLMTQATSLRSRRVTSDLSSPALISPDFFTSNCFVGVTTQSYSSTGGTYPKATYTGNYYFSGGPTGPGCAYTPPELYKAYHLNGLFAEGYNGAGQTINIIDACGSPTIQHDANVFSARFGLPLLTSSNFRIIQVPPSTCASPNEEINLDVEWAHAIAPGANINLIESPSYDIQDTDEATFYVVNYDLGNVISGSYGYEESLVPQTILATVNLILEIAAISGISADYSSGDLGDNSVLGIPPTVLVPADSPWATGVGGVSVALNPDDSIAWQAGWGNQLTYLDNQGTIYDPPCQPNITCGFIGGSGGGPSAVFAKPSFQVGVPGTFRQVPDISWLADSFTGVVISISEPYSEPPLVWTLVGGTSVSCPMFSGLWAIANEEAGASGPLGQAAPYVYALPASAITDIVPIISSHNVTATIHDSPSVTRHYNPAQVMGVREPFYSAIWDQPFYQDLVNALSFGSDQGLHTSVGWDDVTGVGTPNAKAFADAFKP